MRRALAPGAARRHRLASTLVLGGLAVCPALADEVPATTLAVERATRIVELLNEDRAERGLARLAVDPRLEHAARAQVADMLARGYFALEAADGRTVDDWVAETDYQPQLLAQKLLRSSASPETLALRWTLEPEASAQSLFHPGVREVGLVAAWDGEAWIHVVTLGTSRLTGLLEAGSERERALAILAAQLDAARVAFLAALNRDRSEGAAPEMVAEPALHRAAQAHASALAREREREAGDETQDLRRNRVAPLAERVETERRARSTTAHGGARGGSVIYQRQVGDARGSAQTVGEVVVLDAEDVDQAVALALASARAEELRAPRRLRFGLGFAVARVGGEAHPVWVACAAPPPR